MSKEVLRALLRAKQRNKCCYCGVKMVRRKMEGCPKGGWPADTETIEHLRRRSEGGTNARDNLALACSECNTGRGLTDWLTYTSYRRGELTAA